MAYFAKPSRAPTPREAAVERILTFLEHPPEENAPEWDTLRHRFIGVYFSARQIQTIRDLIAENRQYTRARLAREVCMKFNLYQPNGKMRSGIVGDILKRMDMDNIVTLPAIPHGKGAARKGIRKPLMVPQEMVEVDPRDQEELLFIPVEKRQDADLWNAIIREYHYIKSYRLFGPQLRYLVYGNKRRAPQGHQAATDLHHETGGQFIKEWYRQEQNKPRAGHLLAALGFAASAWRLSSRDEFIGWTDEQRATNLRHVVGNARFLILPWIKSPNLASRILSGIARRLAQDWEDRYHYRPVLLETFVQLDRFHGTCYKAANWIRLGITGGYSLYGTKQKKQVPSKAVFVYPLTRKFREVLCGTGVHNRG